MAPATSSLLASRGLTSFLSPLQTLSNVVLFNSIHCKRVPTEDAVSGQSASLALKKVKRQQIRRGMVLVAASEKPFASWTFEAEVLHAEPLIAQFDLTDVCSRL